ncbi:MAG: hypothetical protein RLZZ45_1146 [Bacteroidota bacterium]
MSTRSYSWTFYLSLLLLSILQAYSTELFDDEAYYWVYAQFLDWGYFDHPPMIALLIKMGISLFPGELGVRFFIVLMGVATIWLIEKILQPNDKKLFYVLVLNTALLQIGGILAVPDVPLLFFIALFFWAYQRFEEKANGWSALFLAQSIALLLYSKYHGLLIILFTLFSNIQLLKRWYTWLVILLSILLFLPHAYWQWQHGFPSIQYHLFERVSPPYRFWFTTDYLLGQLLITGPLTGWLLIGSALKYRTQTSTEKAMYWSVVGTFLLFFISSFRSRTEANWTAMLLVPLIVLSYQYLKQETSLSKWLYRLLPFSLIIVLAIRVFMLLDIDPIKGVPKDEFHGNKEWAKAIREKANGLPVIFTNSYQMASKYWFYTGDPSFSLNTLRYRRSQYNYWPMEQQLIGSKIMVVGSMDMPWLKDSIHTKKGKLATEVVDGFRSFSGILLSSMDRLQPNANGVLEAAVGINAFQQEVLDSVLWHRPKIMLIVYQDGEKEPLVIPTGKRLFPDFVNQVFVRIPIPDTLTKDKYTVRWGLAVEGFPEPTINSKVYTLLSARK